MGLAEGLKFMYIGSVPVLDYEDFASRYDALYLTLNGMLETGWTSPGLWGWDCECIFVYRKEVVIPLSGGRSLGERRKYGNSLR